MCDTGPSTNTSTKSKTRLTGQNVLVSLASKVLLSYERSGKHESKRKGSCSISYYGLAETRICIKSVLVLELCGSADSILSSPGVGLTFEMSFHVASVQSL